MTHVRALDGTRFGIAGAGLIGGSIALRVRELGATVRVFDRDAAVIERARACGAADASAADLRALAAQCDVLVLAMPVDATCAALVELTQSAGPLPDLILDVASVKCAVVAAGARLAQFVGTHPIAGREQGGIAEADARLFCGAAWAHVPHADAARIARVRALIVAMDARPFEIDAADHDEILAMTSHLPQLLSVLLGSELADAERADGRVAELSGTGMQSMLRLARSPESVWGPIFAANARPVAARVRSFARALADAADALDEADISRLMAYFGNARRGTPAAPLS